MKSAPIVLVSMGLAGVFWIQRPGHESEPQDPTRDVPQPALNAEPIPRTPTPKASVPSEGEQDKEDQPLRTLDTFLEELQRGTASQQDVANWLLWSTTLAAESAPGFVGVTLDLESSATWTQGTISKHPATSSRGPRLEWRVDGEAKLPPSHRPTPIKLQVVVGFDDDSHQDLDLINVIVQQDYPFTTTWQELLASEQVTGACMTWEADASKWFPIYSSSAELSEGTEFAQRFGEEIPRKEAIARLPEYRVLADFSESL